jgi:CMP-N,N'-diacetyllegionaminic acid synthase
MRVLGLIPARGGSKGIPQKNIKLLGVKPLLAYTLESAQQAKGLTDIMVSTDNPVIAEVASSLGHTPPFLRPASLSTDDASSFEVVLHAIKTLAGLGKTYDAVCLLQPTCPFREHGFIDAAINRFIAEQADALVSVLPVPHQYNPYWTFKVQGNLLKISTGDEHLISRRQDLPTIFHRDGSVYLTKVSAIEAGSLYGSSLAYIESNPEWYVNIDTPEDWTKAEHLLAKYSQL